MIPTAACSRIAHPGWFAVRRGVTLGPRGVEGTIETDDGMQ
jgi:hypothetical protein